MPLTGRTLASLQETKDYLIALIGSLIERFEQCQQVVGVEIESVFRDTITYATKATVHNVLKRYFIDQQNACKKRNLKLSIEPYGSRLFLTLERA